VNRVRVLILALATLGFTGIIVWSLTEQNDGDQIKILGALPRDEDAGDRGVLFQLQRAGSDLSRAADIRYFLYVPRERDANAAAWTLCRRGFQAGTDQPSGSNAYGSDWAVIARQNHVPSITYIRSTRSLFSALAAKYNGVYDGWEASIERPGDNSKATPSLQTLADHEMCGQPTSG